MADTDKDKDADGQTGARGAAATCQGVLTFFRPIVCLSVCLSVRFSAAQLFKIASPSGARIAVTVAGRDGKSVTVGRSGTVSARNWSHMKVLNVMNVAGGGGCDVHPSACAKTHYEEGLARRGTRLEKRGVWGQVRDACTAVAPPTR